MGAMTRTPVIIAIDGRSGAGKTTLAGAVRAELPGARVLHMDDLYPGWDGLAAAVEILTDDVLAPLRHGRPGRYRRFDWHAMAYAEEHRIPAATPVLVVEGCGATVGDAGRLTDLRIWVTAATGVRKARGLTRDHGDFAPHWQAWAAQEDRLFAQDGTRARADLVVVTDP